MTVKEALEAAGFKPEFGQVTMKADVEIELAGDDAVRMQKLIDVLESLDDVQDVYTNAVMGE
jgi:transcriptional/translational regulatory protein YebC/TACO1